MASYSKKQVKYGIVISYFVLILSIIIHFVTTPLYLKYLGDNAYGIKAFCNSLVSYVSLLTMGMSSSYVRFYTKYEKESGDEAIKKVNSSYLLFFLFASALAILVVGIILSTIKTGIVPLNQYNAEEKNTICIIFLVLSFSTILSFVFSVYDLNIVANERFIFKNILNCFITVLNPIITLLFLFNGFGVITTVVIASIISIVQMLLNAYYSIFVLKIRFNRISKEDLTLVKEIIVFSSYIFIIQIVGELNNESDKIILGLMVGSTSVTYYQIGTQFRGYLNTLATTISNSYAPYINRCVLEGNKEKINLVFNKVSEMQMMILLFVVGGFAACGLQFTRAWLGTNYDISYYVAICVLTIQTCSYSQLTSVEIQRAMNKHKFRAWLYLAVAIVNILISIVLCKAIGIMGCVIGTVISYAFQLFVMNIYNYKVIGINLRLYWQLYAKNFMMSFCPVLICLVLGIFQVFTSLNSSFKWIETILLGCIYAFLYVLMQLGFNKENFYGLIHKLMKRSKE